MNVSSNLDEAFDTYSKYDKVLLIGDFNIEISEQRTESFLYMHELCNLVKEKTCFKNMQNPNYVELMMFSLFFYVYELLLYPLVFQTAINLS